MAHRKRNGVGRNGHPAAAAQSPSDGDPRITAAQMVPQAAATNGTHVERMTSLGAMMREFTLSSLVQRMDFARRVGLTYDGRRDIYNALGYTRTLSFSDYMDRYRRGGIAERIVETYPFATWASGARVVEDIDSQTETPFEHDVRVLFEKLDAWTKLLRADILACIGHFSVLLIGAPGNYATELKSAKRIDFLRPVGEDNVRIATFNEDKFSERYGKPLTYEVVIKRGDVQQITLTVHYTRVVHIATGLLEDDIYGKPCLRAPWNYLDDLDKLVGGGSEAAWTRMSPGMQVDVDPEMEFGVDEERQLSAELDEFQDGLRRTVRTRGTKINMLAGQVQGFGPNAQQVMQMISATTGIPLNILTGTERGQRAQAHDRFNWSDRISERRRCFATPVVRQFIQRCIDAGVIRPPKSEDEATIIDTSSNAQSGYDVIWPEVGDISDSEKADMVNKLAAAAQAMSIAGMPPPLTTDEIRHLVYGYGPHKPEVLAAFQKSQEMKAQAAKDAAASRVPGGVDGEASGTQPTADSTQVSTKRSGNNTPNAPSRGAAAGT